MNVLVLNCGSSSLKYQLLDMDSEKILVKGICERIGIDGYLKHSGPEKVHEINVAMPDHEAAVKLVLDALVDKDHGAIKSMDEVHAIGHRVVHGGEHFSDSVIITDEVEKAIEDCCDLAPLHNPPNLVGIRACKKIMPGISQVAVFDTAFHATMPEEAYLYAIPFELYEKYKIRKYGFHGTSHKFVAEQAAKTLGKPVEQLKLVTCHLGNGASICAVDGGRSIDTSMGLTPLEGLAMGTRSGDLDPAVITFIMQKENKTAAEVLDMLNKKSGMLGVSGVSSDFRDLGIAESEGNKRAKSALDLYCYRVAQYIGSYAVAMHGIDALIFTAGIGENDDLVRARTCSHLGFLGIEIDLEKNNVRGKARELSTDNSKVKVLIVPTNEELVIARDTKNLLK